jgi:hypothetical protein
MRMHDVYALEGGIKQTFPRSRVKETCDCLLEKKWDCYFLFSSDPGTPDRHLNERFAFRFLLVVI